MKSYNDLLKQVERITALWSMSDFDAHLDNWIDMANKAFAQYKARMQKHLASHDKHGRYAGDGCYWAETWGDNLDAKLPRNVYAGY